MKILQDRSMLDHKTSFSKVKKIEITPSVFSDYNGTKLEIKNKRKIGKVLTMWKLTHF